MLTGAILMYTMETGEPVRSLADQAFRKYMREVQATTKGTPKKWRPSRRPNTPCTRKGGT